MFHDPFTVLRAAATLRALRPPIRVNLVTLDRRLLEITIKLEAVPPGTASTDQILAYLGMQDPDFRSQFESAMSGRNIFRFFFRHLADFNSFAGEIAKTETT